MNPNISVPCLPHFWEKKEWFFPRIPFTFKNNNVKPQLWLASKDPQEILE